MNIMLSEDGPDGDVEQSGELRMPCEPPRTILLLTMEGAISERLCHALQREFPWVVVERVDVAKACAVFAHPVALILVDSALLKDAEKASRTIVGQHPQAVTAAIEFEVCNTEEFYPQIVDSQLVRSLLPMNLRLDVWLAVIRLMLCGGEYFPTGMVRYFSRGAGNRMMNGGLRAPSSLPRVNGHAFDLTAREVQILELVSRGLQNKTIASEFQLSESTVKIHLHNIISKLGAHNRTDAVARFQNFHSMDRYR